MSDDFLDATVEITVAGDRDAVLKKTRATGRAILILLIGGRRGERAVLGEEQFVIGRGSNAHLQVDSDAVSRVHARIEKRGNAHVLIDARSTNGSFVNYQRVTERVLRDGDQIQIGHALLKYLSGDNIETAYHEEFRHLVRHDALTGALNHATYLEELRTFVGRAEHQRAALCLVLFDLDHFKPLNDENGHTAGDLVLKRVAAQVNEATHAPHLFARVGGEEFGILFWGKVSEARVFAEALRQSISALEIEYEGKTLRVTASFGIASFEAPLSDEAEPSQALHQAADIRLYEAKSSGRNCVKG